MSLRRANSQRASRNYDLDKEEMAPKLGLPMWQLGSLLLIFTATSFVTGFAIAGGFQEKEVWDYGQEGVMSNANTKLNAAATAAVGKWEGLTSTTYFDEDGKYTACWGDVMGIKVCPQSISNPAYNPGPYTRMSGAIPWQVVYKKFGSKNSFVGSVFNSARDATQTDKSCLLVQPVSKYMDQVTGATDSLFDSATLNNFCTSNCVDINDETVLPAVDGNGNKYPVYFVVPFEGCGGNCKPFATQKDTEDCMNDSCLGTCSNSVDTQNVYAGNFGNIPSCKCDALKSLWQQGTWPYVTGATGEAFAQYSDTFAISPETQFGRQFRIDPKTGQPEWNNWCSGQNAHLDLESQGDPDWLKYPKGNIAQTNDPKNIMMRYQWVQCNLAGTFDTTAGMTSPGSLGYISCPPNSWYCDSCPDPTSSKCIKPGDPRWTNSQTATNNCCMN